MSADYTPFRDFIKNRSGLAINSDQTDTLGKAIHEMMAKKGLKSETEYFRLINSDYNEFLNLVSCLTINETYFFREPGQMKVLTELVMPDILLNKKKGDKIQIISAGCSSGAEPYSIVIALMEKYGAGIKNSISVIGFDIDNNAIPNAEKGVYGKSFFRILDPGLKEKYFDDIGKNRHQIKPFVRENVTFQNINLLNDDYPLLLEGADIIFYRNVSIYFEPEHREKVFFNLANILNPNGYLIMGAVETLHHNFSNLALIEMGGIFLYKKIINSSGNKIDKESDCQKQGLRSYENEPEKAVFSFSDALKKLRIKPKEEIDPEPTDHIARYFNEALSLANEKKYNDAIRIIDDIIKLDPAYIKPYGVKAQILLNLNQIEESRKLCLRMIETDKLCTEGYLLLGLIARLGNDRPEAIKRFKEALYIAPTIWLSHFHLAEIYQEEGKFKQVVREYQTVIKLIKQNGFENHGLSFCSFMSTPQQLKHFCEQRVKTLTLQ